MTKCFLKELPLCDKCQVATEPAGLRAPGREKKAWLNIEEPPQRGWEAGYAFLRPLQPAGSSRHEDGHLVRAGQMAFTCSGHAPWCWGPWSCGDNNGQLPALGPRSAGFQRLGSVQGEGASLGPPHPRQLAFCFEICAPHPPPSRHQHLSNKSSLIEDSSVLETTRKRLVECDLASPLSSLPPLCVRLQWVLF